MNGTRRSRITGRIVDLATPLLALGMALLVGAVMLALLNTNPMEAYGAAWSGVMTKNGMADTLVKAIPLALVGLGIVIAFRANVINIGAEGQIIVGALATTYVAVEIGERMPGWSLIILATAAGMLAGGLWAALPGFLKARMQVNEILSTVMMNQIAIQLGFFLLRGPMIDPKEVAAGTNLPHSARLPASTDFARISDIANALGFTKSAEELGLSGWPAELYGLFVEPTRLHTGIFVVIVAAILVYVMLYRTTWGYRIRAVGLNPFAARYAGIVVPRTVVMSLALSGAFAGLAGAVEILGLHHRMYEPTSVSAGYGFSGIVAALFGKLHPLGVLPSSVLFGGLLVGGDKMQRAMQVPQALVTMLLGLVVLFVVSSDIWQRRRARREG